MRSFNPPQCPHCAAYPFSNEAEYQNGQVGWPNDKSEPILVECTECGKQFEILESDVIGEM